MSYILDACALIAFLDREPGWEKVHALNMQAGAGDILMHMHIVTVLEVYYGVRRAEGPEAAQEILDYVDRSAIRVSTDMSAPLIREAGRFKITYDMSLADTFVCAAAALLSATLVTSDGELEPINAAEPITFYWFRPPKEKQAKKKAVLQTIIAERDTARRELAEANRRIAELEAAL
jgi:predicted nucleic acid-binding protein